MKKFLIKILWAFCLGFLALDRIFIKAINRLYKKETKANQRKSKMKKKKQGYNARLDESLAMRRGKKKKQSMKARRDESKGMEKAMGKKAYSSVKTMDKKKKKKKSKK